VFRNNNDVEKIKKISNKDFYEIPNKAILLLSTLSDENPDCINYMFDFIVNNFSKKVLESPFLNDGVFLEKVNLFLNLAKNNPVFDFNQLTILKNLFIPIENFLNSKQHKKNYFGENLINSSMNYLEKESKIARNKIHSFKNQADSSDEQEELEDEVISARNIKFGIVDSKIIYSMSVFTKKQSFEVAFGYKSLHHFQKIFGRVLEKHILTPLPHLPVIKSSSQDEASDAKALLSHILGFFQTCILRSDGISQAKSFLMRFMVQNIVENSLKPLTDLDNIDTKDKKKLIYKIDTTQMLQKTRQDNTLHSYVPISNMIVPSEQFCIKNWLKYNQFSHLIPKLQDITTPTMLFNLTENDLKARSISDKTIIFFMKAREAYQSQLNSLVRYRAQTNFLNEIGDVQDSNKQLNPNGDEALITLQSPLQLVNVNLNNTENQDTSNGLHKESIKNSKKIVSTSRKPNSSSNLNVIRPNLLSVESLSKPVKDFYINNINIKNNQKFHNEGNKIHEIQKKKANEKLSQFKNHVSQQRFERNKEYDKLYSEPSYKSSQVESKSEYSTLNNTNSNHAIVENDD
ncbi:MAG: hypothetical protein MHPSP_001685, partial [Paramarteilia canceri]